MRPSPAFALPVVVLVLAGCPGPGHVTRQGADVGPLSRAGDAHLVTIPSGQYVAGSTPEERDTAYDDYLATAGHDTAREREWFAREEDRHVAELPAFRIDLLAVTNAQFAEFVATGGGPPPVMDEGTWKAQGFLQDYAAEVTRFLWDGARPPAGREDHPVVLVSWDHAVAYCAWRGTLVGEDRRLPTAAEREKASRGTDGRTYPWGNAFDASRLNSGVSGPGDTMPVGSFSDGASPYGVLDLAGNVFEWTSTPWPPGAADSAAERTVRGSAWEDHAGVGRGASWHGRRRDARHIIVGFRCAAEAVTP
jgi:formylglycine-generating enzyme required for sulfatase activity